MTAQQSANERLKCVQIDQVCTKENPIQRTKMCLPSLNIPVIIVFLHQGRETGSIVPVVCQ